MKSYVTLTNESNPGTAPVWWAVVDPIHNALRKLHYDALAMGVIPNWDSVEIRLETEMVEIMSFSGSEQVTGRKTLSISVQANTDKEDDGD